MASYSTTRSDSGESQSTTLSEFVQQRWSGKTPVFGGNPRVGASEFASAANTDILQAMNQLTGALQGFSTRFMRQEQSRGSTMPISMVPESLESPTDIADAIKLDDAKVQLMLSASAVEPRDLQRYFLLFATAKDALKKKKSAIESHNLRKAARVQTASVAEIPISQLEGSEAIVDAVASKFGFKLQNDDQRLLLLRAITHDSYTQGRETNRVLAHIGDSAMKLVLAKFALDTGMTVSDVSDMIQKHQTNLVLRDIGVSMGLAAYVRKSEGTDPTAKAVMATVVEAILGVIYLSQGETGVSEAMVLLGVGESTPRNTPHIG